MITALLAAGGKVDSAVGTDPAANTESTVTVPSGNTWVILCAHLPVVQGATQTPLPQLQITNAAGAVVGLYPGASAAMSVSTTSTFDWFEGAALTAGAGATSNRASIPRGLAVKAGWVISTVTTGKGANTDLGPLALHVIAI